MAEAITNHNDVITGIEGLRSLGDAGVEALDAVLAIPSVRQLVLSWQLAEALADGDSTDLEAHLIHWLGYDHATYVRSVLFPSEEHEQPALRLVVG